MTKLTKAQDAAIESKARTGKFEWSKRGSAGTHNALTMAGLIKIIWEDEVNKRNGRYELTDSGRAYAIERGWLAAEAAPVAEVVETEETVYPDYIYGDMVWIKGVGYTIMATFVNDEYSICRADGGTRIAHASEFDKPTPEPQAAAIPAIQERVLASEVCIGDTLYRRVYGEGVVKAIMHDTLSDKGVPYDIRFTFEDGREMFCDRDYLVFRKPTQTALPALPDSQFVDAGTHVAIDKEVIEGMAALPDDFDSVAHLRQDLHPDSDYGRALQQVRFFAADLMEKNREIFQLESELAAARAEIAALQKRVIDFAEWHFDGADPFRYKLIETVISLVEYEKRATES